MTDILVVAKRIEKTVCALYQELVDFFLQATIFFSKNPVGEKPISLIWKYMASANSFSKCLRCSSAVEEKEGSQLSGRV